MKREKGKKTVEAGNYNYTVDSIILPFENILLNFLIFEDSYIFTYKSFTLHEFYTDGSFITI